jgi:phosphoribosylaminoimidazolecarboxamide formyltransferase/IMP cyclohydrolase
VPHEFPADEDSMTIRTALMSVSNKSGLADFARELAALGVRILSTGGTAKHLRDAGIAVEDVSSVTNFPEMLDGRVKTLHPAIHGGLLARRDLPEHMAAIKEHNISTIDLVVNLYPFAETVAKPGVTPEEAIEQIDIGGPSMLRSAAKNHAAVTVVCDPADYDAVLKEVKGAGDTTLATRTRLAAKVFQQTAVYDGMIASWMEKHASGEAERLPEILTFVGPREIDLRYGENPHQRAAFYRDPACRETNVASAKLLQGKALSYNNILDAEGALEMVRDFADLAPAASVIVKHSNPCGIALGETALESYDRARETDPDSAFGGIIALTTQVDGETAARIADTFNEVVIAPSYSAEALEILAKKKNMRVLETGPFTPKERSIVLRGVVGGVLATDRDLGLVSKSELKVVSKAQPSDKDLDGLLFAWRCVKWVKSNAIVYTDHVSTIGIGAGQMSRVDSSRIGVLKARRPLAGAFMASDAFFPFRDNVDAAAKTGIRAIIQPGGSVRDEEVIAAADEHGLVMVFTGMRHFRH